MQLKEFMQLPLDEALKTMEMVKTEIFADGLGEVKAIEIRYVAKSLIDEGKKRPGTPRLGDDW